MWIVSSKLSSEEDLTGEGHALRYRGTGNRHVEVCWLVNEEGADWDATLLLVSDWMASTARSKVDWKEQGVANEQNNRQTIRLSRNSRKLTRTVRPTRAEAFWGRNKGREGGDLDQMEGQSNVKPTSNRSSLGRAGRLLTCPLPLPLPRCSLCSLLLLLLLCSGRRTCSCACSARESPYSTSKVHAAAGEASMAVRTRPLERAAVCGVLQLLVACRLSRTTTSHR